MDENKAYEKCTYKSFILILILMMAPLLIIALSKNLGTREVMTSAKCFLVWISLWMIVIPWIIYKKKGCIGLHPIRTNRPAK